MANEQRLYQYSSSPHVKAPRTTKQIMARVCIALLPSVVAGIIFFGLDAALIIALAVISAVASEGVYLLACKKTVKEIIGQFDFTSMVTGLLVGLSIGVNYPWYAPILGSVFAVVVVKMLFGGTGKNVVNPAVTGRIFIFMSFQAVVGAWVVPSIGAINGLEVQTGATVLGSIFGQNLSGVSNIDLLLGTGLAGCIGETCKIALIVGGIYLAIEGIINIGYPIIYIAVTGLFTVALNGFDFNYFLPAILSGGLIFGAIFMATDYTTTPNTTSGNVIYFVLLGLITAGLRQATQMEVVSFAILLGNLLVPIIDKFVINKPFGFVRAKKEKENKNA